MLDHIRPQPSLDPLALLAGIIQTPSEVPSISAQDASLAAILGALHEVMSDRTLSQNERYAILATCVASQYVRQNVITPCELVDLVRALREAFVSDHAQSILRPAVPIDQSVTGAYIFCLEDGHACKSLQRYLKRRFNMSPHAYRQRWGLPDDYPMVAPEYAQRRSGIAKQTGLGQRQNFRKQ